jgi:hypothetical protein
MRRVWICTSGVLAMTCSCWATINVDFKATNSSNFVALNTTTSWVRVGDGNNVIFTSGAESNPGVYRIYSTTPTTEDLGSIVFSFVTTTETNTSSILRF